MDLGGVVVEGGSRLHVEEIAPGDREPAIVLLHGFGASSTTWSPMAPLLQASAVGRRVIAFDRLGFGRSDRPTRGAWSKRHGERIRSPYHPAAAGAHTIAVLDALEIERAVLVGHSAGALAAVLVALDAPHRVAGLGLIAPALLADGPPRLVSTAFGVPGVAVVAPWILARAAGPLMASGLRRAWHDPSLVDDEVIERYRAPLRRPGWEQALVEMTRASVPLRLASRLDGVVAPAVVVAGSSDRIVRERDARRIDRLLGGPSTLIVVPNAGHLVHEEQPRAVVEALTSLW